jgi:plastocyanin
MTRSIRRRSAAFGLALLMLGAFLVPAAHAGQVRVNVGPASTTTFSPYAVNINQGDHVVWVWIGSSHTVTNWTIPTDSVNVNWDGTIFDSQSTHVGQPNTTRFSWKSDRTGHVPYVCVPHIGDNMSGRVIISPLTQPPTIPVADFRLTEVQFNVASGLDLIEISNLGGAAGDLRSFRLAAGGAAVPIVATDFPVAAGGRVVIHTNEAGTNNTPPGHIYGTGLGALNDASGSLSLYVPSTVAAQSALTNAALLLDFVQWGAGAQANESTAGSVNFWTAGEFIDGVAAGHSIAYCANQFLTHGIDRWAEISPPSLGDLNDCGTPVLSQTWGMLKVLYRP